MQRKQSKNSRESIGRIWKIWHGKSTKKKRSDGKNCWEGSQQRNYMDGQISNTTRNIREDWKETGDDGRAGDQQEEGR